MLDFVKLSMVNMYNDKITPESDICIRIVSMCNGSFIVFVMDNNTYNHSLEDDIWFKRIVLSHVSAVFDGAKTRLEPGMDMAIYNYIDIYNPDTGFTQHIFAGIINSRIRVSTWDPNMIGKRCDKSVVHYYNTDTGEIALGIECIIHGFNPLQVCATNITL